MTTCKNLAASLILVALDLHSQTLAERLDSLLARWNQQDGPGTAVLLVRDGKAEYRKSFGLADLDQRSPITADTQFQLESVSKQFTAMGIMILADHGKLRLEDPLSRFCPEFPACARSITIRQLLNHTSGLHEYDLGDDPDAPGYFRSFRAPRAMHEYTAAEALAAQSREKQLNFPPGHYFEYSNGGYMVLAQVIERVTAERYGDFLKEAIFDPLGMRGTLVLDERQRQPPAHLATRRPPKDGATYLIFRRSISMVTEASSAQSTTCTSGIRACTGIVSSAAPHWSSPLRPRKPATAAF